MADGGFFDTSGSNVPITVSVDGMQYIKTLIRLLTDAQDRQKDISANWKEQDSLLEELAKHANKFSLTRTQQSAEDLLNTFNALRATFKDGVLPSDIEGKVAAYNSAISNARDRANPNAVFSVEQFKEGFEVLQLLKDGAGATEGTIKSLFNTLASAAGTEEYKSRIEELEYELESLRNTHEATIQELDTFKSGEAFEEQREQIQNLEMELDRYKDEAEAAFKSFLFQNNIRYDPDTYNYNWDEFFGKIRNEGATAIDVIQTFKEQHAELIETSRQGISDDGWKQFANTIVDLSEKINSVLTQIEELRTNGVRVADSGNINNTTQALDQEGNAIQSINSQSAGLQRITEIIQELLAMSSNGGEVASSSSGLDQLVQVLTKLDSISNVGENSLMNLRTALFNLSSLKEFKFSGAGGKNLFDFLAKVESITDVSNIRALASVNLNGFANLKISKASLSNLAEYLPRIADVDVSGLQAISKVDLTKFNNVKVSKGAIAGVSELVDKLSAAGFGMQQLQDAQNAIGSSSGKQGAESENLIGVKAEDMLGSFASAATAAQKLMEGNSNAVYTPSYDKLVESFTAVRMILNECDGDAEKLKAALDELGIDPVLALHQLRSATNTVKDELTELGTAGNVSYEQVSSLYTRIQNTLHRNVAFSDTESFSKLNEAGQLLGGVLEECNGDASKLSQALERVGLTGSTALDGAKQALLDFNAGLSSTGSVSYDEVSRLYTRIQNTLHRNVAFSDTENYSKLNEAGQRLGGVLKECDGDASRLSQAFERMGLTGAKSFDEAKQALLDFNAEVATEGVKPDRLFGNSETMLRQITNAAASAEKLLINNPNAINMKSYDGLVDKLNIVRNIIQLCGGDASRLRDVLQQLGVGFDIKDTMQTKLAGLKEELIATGQGSQALKEAHNNMVQYDNVLTQSSKTLNKYESAQYSSNSQVRDAYTALNEAKNTMTSNAEKVEQGSISQKEFADSILTTRNELANFNSVINSSGGGIERFLRKFSYLFSTTRIIMLVIRYMREMIKTSIELDSAFTQMQIVTKASDSQMSAFAQTASKAAKETASSIKEITESATTFARLGYSLEESGDLASYVAKLTNVGAIETSEAQEAITSILKAFSSEVDTSNLESVMDKLVETGNNFPISVAQLAEGMKNASSTLAAAGNSYEESVALLTAANTTVQNASKASTGLRTIAARLRKTSTELDDLGESMTESAYGEIVKGLTDAKVALTDANGEYRSTYDILSDLAAVWDTLSSSRQAAIATALSGTRQQAIFYSIIGQFQEARGAMEAMANSEGALNEANDTYLTSVEAHSAQLKVQFQTLAQDLFNSNLLSGVIDLGASLLNAADGFVKVISAMGGFKTLLIAISGLILSIKIDKWLSGLGTAFSSIVTFFPRLITAIRGYYNTLRTGNGVTASFGTALNQAGISASAMSIGVGLVTAAITGIVIAISLAKQQIEEYNRQMREAREKNIEAGKEASETSKRLDEAENNYFAIAKAVENGTSSMEDMITAQNELMSAYEDEGIRLDTLIEKYGDYAKAIRAARAEELKESKIDVENAVTSAKENLLSAIYEEGDNGIGFDRIFTGMTDESEKTILRYSDELKKRIIEIRSLYEIVKNVPEDQLTDEAEGILLFTDALTEVYKKYGVNLSGDYALFKDIGKVKTVDDAIKLYDELSTIIAYLHNVGFDKIDNGGLYTFLTQTQQSLSDYLDVYNTAMSDLEKHSLEEIYNTLLSTQDLPKTQEEFDKFFDNMIKRVESLQNAGTIDADADPENLVKTFLVSQQEMSEYTQQWELELAGVNDVLGSTVTTIETEKEALEKYNDALSVANSETGLTAEAIGVLKGRFGSLVEDGYDWSKLFINTANGIRLNNTELQRLEAEYKKATREKIGESLEENIKQYNLLAIKIAGATSEAEKNRLESSRESLKERIEETAELASQYETLTGAYKDWLDAQDGTDFRATYEGVAGGYEDIEELINNGWANDSEVTAYLDVILNPKNRTGDNVTDFNSLLGNISGTSFSIGDFFTVNEDGDLVSNGLENFMKAVNEKLGSEYASFNNGVWTIDFSGDKLSDVATALGLSEEMVSYIVTAMQDQGLTVNFEQAYDYTSKMKDNVEDVVTDLKNSGYLDKDFTIDFSNITIDDITTLWNALSELREKNGGVLDLEDENTNRVIELLVSARRKYEIAQNKFLSSATLSKDASEDASRAYEIINEAVGLYSDYTVYVGLGMEPEANTASEAIKTLMEEASTNPVFVPLKLNYSSPQAFIQSLGNVTDEQWADAGFDVESEVDQTVTYEPDTSKVDQKNTEIESNPIKQTVEYSVSWSPSTWTYGAGKYGPSFEEQYGLPGADGKPVRGTAQANGNAFANMHRFIGDDDHALGGELGRELVVRDGRYFTIGDNSAEFFKYKKGDIIFNAQQTEQLLNGGKIRHGSKRGKAYAQGNAFAGANASGKIYVSSNGQLFRFKAGDSDSDSDSSKDEQETWFERELKSHQYMRAMERESDRDYFNWLSSASAEAYQQGIIDLDDYRDYAEEVFSGLKDLVKDNISDLEHEIDMRSEYEGETKGVLIMHKAARDQIEKDIADARARGLDDDDDYIQELQDKWMTHNKAIIDIEEDTKDEAEDQMEELIDFRVEMLKKDLENQKDALDKQLDALSDFYSKQKDMLNNQKDAEDYAKDQAEHQKNIADIQSQLTALANDNSAWAQKRKAELREELKEAQDDYTEFERDHSYEVAEKNIDNLQEAQEKLIENQKDAIDKQLDDPKALRDQAIEDIKNGGTSLYQEMIDWNNKYGNAIQQDIIDMWEGAYKAAYKYKQVFGEDYKGIVIVNATGYDMFEHGTWDTAPVSGTTRLHYTDGYEKKGLASGTSNATKGWHRIDEYGSETIFESANGQKYRMFSGGEKVLNARASDFLYNFANSGGSYLTSALADSRNTLNKLLTNVSDSNITMGDIIIQGNADQATVSEIRRAQRESVNFMLKEFNRLNKR